MYAFSNLNKTSFREETVDLIGRVGIDLMLGILDCKKATTLLQHLQI